MPYRIPPARRRLSAVVGASLVVPALLMGPALSGRSLSMSDTRFAMAITEGVPAWGSAGAFDSAPRFVVPFFSALRVVNEHRVEGVNWYQLERTGGEIGWVDAAHVQTWSSRHALRPSMIAESQVAGYCDWSDAEAAVSGGGHPCAWLQPAAQEDASLLTPFPVLTARTAETADGERQAMVQILAPTLYSDIAPIVSAHGDIDRLQLILLVGASEGATAHREAARVALMQLADWTDGSAVVEVSILAHSPPEGENCPGIQSASGDLGFVGLSEAASFLESMAPCGAAGPSAFWDAALLLAQMPKRPGAQRVLVIVGDSEATETLGGARRGAWHLGGERYKTPGGLEPDQVAALLAPVGWGVTSLVAFQSTELAERLTGRLDFFAVRQIQGDDAGATERLVDVLNEAIEHSRWVSRSIDTCANMLGLNEDGALISLFCGESRDLELAQRVVALKPDPDPEQLVVRPIWIPSPHPMFEDVGLLLSHEARRLAGALSVMAELADRGCDRSEDAWMEAVNSVIPGVSVVSGESLFDRPSLNQHIRDYWQLHSGRSGEALLPYTSDQRSGLSTDECAALRERLRSGSAYILAQSEAEGAPELLWLPFERLP